MTRPAKPQRPARGTPRGGRWLAGPLLVAWPFLASVAIITPAVLLNKTTEVDVQLLLNRLSFHVKEPLQTGLFGSIATRSVTAVSFRSIDLGPGHFDGVAPSGADLAANSSLGPVRLVATDPLARVTLDEVTVQEIRVPKDSAMTMEWEAGDQAGDGQALRLQADAGFGARFSPRSGQALTIRACVGCQLEGLPSGASVPERAARFVASTNQLMSLSSSAVPSDVPPSNERGLGMTIRLELSGGSALTESAIPVPDGVDTTMAEGARRVSAVIGGTIAFPGYALPPHELKAGDVILLGDMPDLRIVSLQIDKGIRVRLHGHAAHVSTGPAGFVADTVPSWFQWYMSSLFPYVHATIALAAVALAVFQKLRSSPSGDRRT